MATIPRMIRVRDLMQKVRKEGSIVTLDCESYLVNITRSSVLTIQKLEMFKCVCLKFTMKF